MTTPNSMPVPDTSASLDTSSPHKLSELIDTPEMIDRMATEMRARSGGELPHAFYVEQVKRQLSGKAVETGPANDEQVPPKPQPKASVFHAWALPE